MIAEYPLMLDFPTITPRDAIERREEIAVRCIEPIIKAFAERELTDILHPTPQCYCITNTYERVVKVILGTVQLSSLWDGECKHEDAVNR